MRIASASLFFTLVACGTSPPRSIATGELGVWNGGTSLPVPRANHCSAAIGNTVFVIGGNFMTPSGFTKTDQITAATLVDGELGEWRIVGRTASPVTECTATASGNTLYVIDGLYDNEEHARKIWHAELGAEGLLGELATMGTLPTIAISSEAAIHDDHLLLMDTQLPAEGDTTVTLRTPLSSVNWTVEDWAIGFRAQAQYAFSQDYIYTIGGYHDPGAGNLTEVFVTPIDGGAPGHITTPIPMPTGFGEALAVDDWIFLVGGRSAAFGGPLAAKEVYASKIGDQGFLGNWALVESLPFGRTNHEVALVGDYLVSTGGASSGPGDTNVLLAQVRWNQSQ